MRIVIYNVAYGTGSPGAVHRRLLTAHRYIRTEREHFDRVADFIEGSNADIVGLLEIDSGSYRTNYRNQAADLARKLKHYHVSSVKYGQDSISRNIPILNSQSNALLARNEHNNVKMHFFRRGFKKLVIEAEVDSVKIFLVHLALSKAARSKQLEHLAELLPANTPFIVAGDFNTYHGEQELADFMAEHGLRNANTAGLPTYPSWNPKKQLDYILYSKQIKLENFSVPRVDFSDHLPLVMDFLV